MKDSTEFQGHGWPLTHDGLLRARNLIGVEEAVVWALVAVESSGFGFFPDRRVKLLFLRDHFHRHTRGRYDASNPDVSNPKAGGYLPGAEVYGQLMKAISIDREAAFKSSLWGIGLVPGSGYRGAGYTSIEAMVRGMAASEDAQLVAFANGIPGERRVALQKHDWGKYLRVLNGQRYDERLEIAYQRFSTSIPDLGLRTAQAALVYLGFNCGRVDGCAGKRTRLALLAFQDRHRLGTSGELDAPTEQALLSLAFPTKDASAL